MSSTNVILLEFEVKYNGVLNQFSEMLNVIFIMRIFKLKPESGTKIETNVWSGHG